MRYRDKELRNVPVETRSGTILGKLSGYVMDSESHEVVQFIVKKAHPLAKILPSELLVHSDQVISIGPDKIVVDDAVETASEREAVASTKHATGTAAPITRTVESAGE
ncbi:PRC-barrel domain-containing protein [Patescibacteria group bacterium]